LLAQKNHYFCRSVAGHATIIDKGHILYCDAMNAQHDNEHIKKRYLSV